MYSQLTVIAVEVDPPNQVSLFLQVPMYALITVGEVMSSISSIDFAYSQVSLCSACTMIMILIKSTNGYASKIHIIEIGCFNLKYSTLEYTYAYIYDYNTWA